MVAAASTAPVAVGACATPRAGPTGGRRVSRLPAAGHCARARAPDRRPASCRRRWLPRRRRPSRCRRRRLSRLATAVGAASTTFSLRTALAHRPHRRARREAEAAPDHARRRVAAVEAAARRTKPSTARAAASERLRPASSGREAVAVPRTRATAAAAAVERRRPKQGDHREAAEVAAGSKCASPEAAEGQAVPVDPTAFSSLRPMTAEVAGARRGPSMIFSPPGRRTRPGRNPCRSSKQVNS